MTFSAVGRELDDLDIAILRELEANGRIAVSDLAQKVKAAETTCHKRIKALKDAGVILGFKAELNQRALGRHLEALISIRINHHARDTLRGFQNFLKELPQTRNVYFMSGERDFLAHVAVRDTNELRAVVTDAISLRDEVAATNTSIIFDHETRLWT